MPKKPDNISQEAWDAVDAPPLTERMLRGMRPAREVLRPALFEKLTKARVPLKTPTKEAVSLRLDRDVLDYFRAKGEGWQTKINEVLRRSAEAEAETTSKGPPKEAATKFALPDFFKKPATPSSKVIKSVSASALTQAPGRTSRGADKKRSK